MQIQELAKRLQKFDLEKELANLVRRTDNEIIDLNTDAQLFDKGIDSTGQSLPGTYAPFTIEIKSALGQPTDRITLKDTGDFHDSFFLKGSGFPFEVDASDSKRNELVSEWGEDIFGLTEENQSSWNDDHLEDVQNIFKKALGIL